MAAPDQAFALTVALAVKSGNNKIIYEDILTALADAANDLSMPCHEQRTGAATGDNCCLPAICLPGVVGVCHRGTAEPAGAPFEGALKMWLPARGLPVV